MGFPMRLYDAHNHAQDDRLGTRAERMGMIQVAAGLGVEGMVVNGSCESDWDEVAALARFSAVVRPAFGYHPWYISERSAGWLSTLRQRLDGTPGASIGEIGLDRWKPGLPYEGQEEVFLLQLELAAERNLPASIHCIQAWGRMLQLLTSAPIPPRGVLLHSYGGPKEMIEPLARRGAYFGFPGYFLHERKLRQRENFRTVPRDRLLVETDAPDQMLPEDRIRFALAAKCGEKPLNHPGNLVAVYEGLAETLGTPVPDLAERVEQNFVRLFGGRA